MLISPKNHEGKVPKEVIPLEETAEARKTAELLNRFIQESYKMLKDHPVNLKRIEEGENPANIIIPRGAGAVPHD